MFQKKEKKINLADAVAEILIGICPAVTIDDAITTDTELDGICERRTAAAIRFSLPDTFDFIYSKEWKLIRSALKKFTFAGFTFSFYAPGIIRDRRWFIQIDFKVERENKKEAPAQEIKVPGETPVLSRKKKVRR